MTDPVRRRAADLLEAVPASAAPRALVGFDGFVDTIARAVASRRSMQPDDFEPIPDIAAFGARIAAAAGRSANLELRQLDVRGGGNGPIMAGALATLGLSVHLVGALSPSADAATLHPAYATVAARCAKAVSIGQTARTDAVEFEDGKIMFNWSAPLAAIDWDHLVRTVGVDALTDLCRDAALIATVNWTNMGGLPSIWRGLRETVLPALAPDKAARPDLFVDLTDPAKRSDDDLRAALEDLASLEAAAPVTLGLNIAEAERLGSLTGALSGEIARDPAALAAAAASLRPALGLSRVLVHNRAGAGADDDLGPAAVATRLVERPVISTGAGDHFNGGFAAARALGLPTAEALACGCDTASRFVRTGKAPARADLIAELRA